MYDLTETYNKYKGYNILKNISYDDIVINSDRFMKHFNYTTKNSVEIMVLGFLKESEYHLYDILKNNLYLIILICFQNARYTECDSINEILLNYYIDIFGDGQDIYSVIRNNYEALFKKIKTNLIKKNLMSEQDINLIFDSYVKDIQSNKYDQIILLNFVEHIIEKILGTNILVRPNLYSIEMRAKSLQYFIQYNKEPLEKWLFEEGLMSISKFALNKEDLLLDKKNALKLNKLFKEEFFKWQFNLMISLSLDRRNIEDIAMKKKYKFSQSSNDLQVKIQTGFNVIYQENHVYSIIYENSTIYVLDINYYHGYHTGISYAKHLYCAKSISHESVCYYMTFLILDYYKAHLDELKNAIYISQYDSDFTNFGLQVFLPPLQILEYAQSSKYLYNLMRVVSENIKIEPNRTDLKNYYLGLLEVYKNICTEKEQYIYTSKIKKYSYEVYSEILSDKISEYLE